MQHLLLSAALASPPNLVVLLADDLGVYDVSAYGGHLVPTPNIDAIGADGVRFDAACVVSPVCAPSRAGLLTGRYPQRFGFEHLPHSRYAEGPFGRLGAQLFAVGDGWELGPPGPVPSRAERETQGLPPDELTLAELLRAEGYVTGVMGKWHLGCSEELSPGAQGFDHRYGFCEAFSIYADPGREDMVNLRLELFADRHQWRQGRRGPHAILRDGVEIEESRYLTQAIAEEAAAFIEENAARPFFLYVPFSAPHAPLQAPREVYDRLAEIEDPRLRVYAALVSALDEAVGEVLGALDRNGLREQTLVVVLSDNGAASYEHIVDNGPLAGGKLTPLEGGLRVPMLARWPGQLPEGAVYTSPVSALDVLPTMLEAAGVTLPEDRAYDGVSLLPFVRGERKDPPHEALFWRSGGQRAVRAGDWKLIWDAATGDAALYDLAQDPGEARDLREAHPEVEARLRALHAAWEQDMAPPSWPPVMRYRIEHAGREWAFPM